MGQIQKTEEIDNNNTPKKKNSQKESSEPTLDDILQEARNSFSGADKGLGLQITSGSNISRASKDSDFIIYKGDHFQQLTGIRGLVFGKVIQIAGRPDSGKSTHAMAFMKSAQDDGVYVILWDAENKFSPARFDNYFHGDSSKLLVVPSKMILAGGDQVEALVNAIMKKKPKAKILIIWDSVGGALPKNESHDPADDKKGKGFRGSKQMAAAAKENGQVMRGFVRLMEEYKDKETNEEKIGILLINQSYSNIGSPGQKESGGQKVEYFSSLILQLTRKKDLIKTINKIKHKIGIVTRAKVKKNHLFDGESSVAELDLLITAGGIRLASEAKLKGEDDWDENDEGEVEELD
jgi:RecA/RadA recombinase